ncbi:hypothetical protein Snoj_71890 [Streptomyces nojiriensis]|uniref:Uncharacterized protein n=1 Tax=Streptomyces nojiriensis TaxID=66374 RepID=A0ABQ3SYP9_9ACTN|nr:hypothetical protein GCM10010205_32760 [Streptomyces nojiriensis]GHI73271.1 hypothetical protein Snoj_71890 [Streptomyces nojiriensis]
MEEGFEALLGAEAACEEHPQVAGGASGGSRWWAGQEVVGDAPGDLLDLAPVGLGGELEEAGGHGAGGDDDRVGGGGGLAQDAQLRAVVLGVEEAGAVDERDPRVGGGGAEGQVVQVQDADLTRVDGGRHGVAQVRNVSVEGGGRRQGARCPRHGSGEEAGEGRLTIGG